MIKSLTTLLACIVSLSIIYYVSFWGSFNINIFQYLAATDIIKGVAYPLRFGVLGVIILVILFLITAILFIYKKLRESETISKEKKFKQLRPILSGIVLLILFSGIFYYFSNDSVLAGFVISLLAYLLTLDINSFIIDTFNDIASGNKHLGAKRRADMLTAVRQFLELPTIIFLVVNALISGQIEANAVKSGKSFDYIATKDLPLDLIKTKQKYLIFLGSAGDKYFFIDKVSNEHFIVDKSVLQALKSFHFESDSKYAQAVFERNIQ